MSGEASSRQRCGIQTEWEEEEPSGDGQSVGRVLTEASQLVSTSCLKQEFLKPERAEATVSDFSMHYPHEVKTRKYGPKKSGCGRARNSSSGVEQSSKQAQMCHLSRVTQ